MSLGTIWPSCAMGQLWWPWLYLARVCTGVVFLAVPDQAVYRCCVPGCVYWHRVPSAQCVFRCCVPGCTWLGCVYRFHVLGTPVLVLCLPLWLMAHSGCLWCSTWQGLARGHLPLSLPFGMCCWSCCQLSLTNLPPSPALSFPGYFVQRSPARVGRSQLSVEVLPGTSTVLAMP